MIFNIIIMSSCDLETTKTLSMIDNMDSCT